jgi:hypothetical protein
MILLLKYTDDGAEGEAGATEGLRKEERQAWLAHGEGVPFRLSIRLQWTETALCN